jgi:hypothetical protein
VCGDAGPQVNMPSAHSCRPECVPESMPGKEDIGGRHGVAS